MMALQNPMILYDWNRNRKKKKRKLPVELGIERNRVHDFNQTQTQCITNQIGEEKLKKET